jgi:hypothetical protein
MTTFREIKIQFNKLAQKKQEHLLKKIWNYSEDMKLFLSGQLLDNADERVFIEKMKKETYGKIKRKGAPGMLNGKTINSIITKAKRSNARISTLIELEKLAYQGFIDFLNEFGGGPDNYEDMAGKHLENCLELIKENLDDEFERLEMFEKTRRFLVKRNNMITNHIDEVFEYTTKISVDR